MIDLRQVSLTLPGPHGPVHILQDVGLQVQAGDTVSIIGASGSGKTSLMMVIAGVQQASGGCVMVAGEDITTRSEDALAQFRRKHIGIVFQNFHLIPTMTALENVAVALEFAGEKDASGKAREALRELGLSHRLDHYPAQLSGGEQQRVALARATATRPSVLLADEPTGNLDSENGRQIMDLLFNLQVQHGTALVLITHDKELAAMTRRQLVMQDGRIHENGKPHA